MTEREAIMILDNERSCCGEKIATFTSEEVYEAYSMAIEALEKQIPSKSKQDGCYDKNGVWHEWIGINGRPYELCPTCGQNLCCEMPYDTKPRYCVNCGQKLDWSGVNG